jgi:hypothetical protein
VASQIKRSKKIMFRRGIFFRVLGVVLFLALLAVGGVAIHRAGMAQGYALGITAASAETGTVPETLPNNPIQMMPYMYGRPFGGWYGHGFHPFGGFGFIFPMFFGLLFFFFIMRLIFRPWGWSHGWHHQGPPPWAKDWEKGERKAEEKPAETPES